MTEEKMALGKQVVVFSIVFSKDDSYNEMLLPAGVMDAFLEGDGNGCAILNGPDGKNRAVLMSKRDGSLYFTMGWKDFHEGNVVEDQDIMQFVYADCLTFKVTFSKPRAVNKPSPSVAVNGNGMEFWKVFLKDESYNKMLIPAEVMEAILEGKSDVSALLHGPLGLKWPILISKENGEWFFTKGWKEFHKGNHVMDKNAIRFTYSGQMTFNVMIFKHPSNAKIKYKTQRKGDTSEKRGRGQPHMVTPKEQKVADAFKSTRPFLIRTLNWQEGKFPSLNIPVTFLRKHGLTLPHNQKILFHNLKGRCWEVNVNNVVNTYAIGKGFPKFLRANNVCHGMVMVYEVMDKSSMDMKVHIYP